MFSKKNAQHSLTRSLLRSLMLFGLLAAAATAYANELTASVDRDSIGAREAVTLTLSLEGQTQNAPDFSSLKNDFEIISNQRSSSLQVINGRRELNTDWQLTLVPKHTGKLLIPSFNLGNAVSDAIEINVSQQNQTTQSDSEQQVRTSVLVNTDSVYVQEQILVTIKLITEVNLSQAKLEPLDIKNAMVVDLGPKQYQTNVNGTAQIVVEHNFAIFPQRAGELIIPSLNYDLVVEDMNSLLGSVFGRSRSSALNLRTEEKHIQVEAIPSQSNSKTWQPASQLTLSETWSGKLNQLKVGEPVTRTITITADDLTAGLIVPLPSTDIDGLTVYPDQAQTKDNKNKGGVQGSRVETQAIVPNRSGDFTLPAIEVQWWNTRRQQLEIASLPAKNLHVIGEPGNPQTQLAPQNPASPAATTAAKPDLPPPVAGISPLATWMLLLAGIFALLSVALAIYVVRLKKHVQRLHQDQADRDSALQTKERDIWDALKTTAATRDASALRKAVLNWAQFQWPAEKINTLDDIAKLAMNEKLTEALKGLDELLYSNHGDTEWDASSLLKLLNEFRKQRKTAKKSPQLESLYRQ